MMDIFDPIHGSIKICGTAKQIIDTIEFQRLRNIKQLGCCYYLFPGASHNRFEHSIGVYHLSLQYMDLLNKEEINFTERQKKCISIAGLVHDIGHGPYSHLFDEIFTDKKNHEYRSYKLLERINEKYQLGFTNEEIIFMKNVIDPEHCKDDHKYLYQIISNVNGIDVDRFDYITRDIKMIGLNYGVEYERIMNHSKIINNEIVYSEKVKNTIDDFFRTRCLMYQEVYNHRTVRCIEFMMKEYIHSLESCLHIKEIIESEQWEKFIEITDSIIDYPPSLCEGVSKQIMNNIKTRNIYKSVGEMISDEPIQYVNNDPNIIIDQVRITYYGKEKYKLYKERNTIYRKELYMGKDLYVLGVYYKNIESKRDALEIVRLLNDFTKDYSDSSESL